LPDHGLISRESQFSVGRTIDRLAEQVQRAGMRVFARIDHGAGAAEVGMELRPTELLLFGHPRGGTPLMLDRQTSGIDLPLKALAWEDAAGRVWLTYDSAAWLARRHELGQASADAIAAIEQALAGLVSGAAAEASG
jgi:uncharacterized protein (DUF302 family)